MFSKSWSMVNLWHTFETSGFFTDFQNFSRVFCPTDDLFRVMVDIVTKVFNDSGATQADLIYQRNRIKNRFKHLWWSLFMKIVNNFSLFHLLSVFHWQFLITYTFSVSLKFEHVYIKDQWGEFKVKNANIKVWKQTLKKWLSQSGEERLP